MRITTSGNKLGFPYSIPWLTYQISGVPQRNYTPLPAVAYAFRPQATAAPPCRRLWGKSVDGQERIDGSPRLTAAGYSLLVVRPTPRRIGRPAQLKIAFFNLGLQTALALMLTAQDFYPPGHQINPKPKYWTTAGLLAPQLPRYINKVFTVSQRLRDLPIGGTP
jgi:hypothetical protein